MPVALRGSCYSLCFLLYIASIWTRSGATVTVTDTCAGEPISDTSDHMSMLQLAFDMQKEKPVQDPASGQNQSDAWREKDYMMVPIHKTGTFMCGEAVTSMKKVLKKHESDGKKVPYFDSAWYSMGFAQNKSADLQRMLTPNPACIMQESRNPFEMVVSSYLYNKAGAEVWISASNFGQSTKANPDDCDAAYDKSTGRITPSVHCPGLHTLSGPGLQQSLTGSTDFSALVHDVQMAAVYYATLSGPLAKSLPDAKYSETYLDYLSRVDMDAGLLAEFVFNMNQSFPTMTYTKNFAEGKPCSLSLCYSDFGESLQSCQATWNKTLRTFEIPQPMQGELAQAAAKSCPQVSKQAKTHDSGHLSDGKKVKHPPEHVMVTHLRELDRTRLNGTLAALEKFYGCPTSGRYREPVSSSK